MRRVTHEAESTTEAASAQKSVAAAATSQFSFGGEAGWRQGPANATSMALFSGDQTCFTSMELKSGSVNESSELQKNEADIASTGGARTVGQVLPVMLQTNAGQQQYKLHQYNVSDAHSTVKLKAGLELGYVQLASGYVKIEGHCDTLDQLPSTLSALRAVKFQASEK